MVQYRQILFSFFIYLLCFFSYSQSFEHRKFKYDWGDEIRVTLNQSSKFKDYEAVVLHEETTLDVSLRNIKRYQVIQFNTEAAINEYNLFRVPIPMDIRSAGIENIYRRDTTGFPKLLYEKINFFDARIIRKGEFVKAVLDETAYRREERTGENLVPYYIHYFYVRNLEPGDQLEVIISHSWPLYTFKYYLNEKLPKQEAYLQVNNSPLGQVDVYTNPQLARFISNEQSRDNRFYKIVFEDLEPVDPSISTYIYDLPRIEMYEDKKYTTTNKLFSSEMVDTVSWKELLYLFVKRIDPSEMRTWENYDLQSYKTTLFFSRMQELAGNQLTGAELMNFINTYAVDHLDYKNDFNYFIHNEHGFTELGNYLENSILREASRHEFYFNMLDRVNHWYYKAFLQDKRLEVIDTSRVGIYYDNFLSYVMFNKDSMAYIFYPKLGRSGYYANELPFYLTDQYVYLIPQTIPRKIYDNNPGDITYPLVYIAPYPYRVNVKRNISTLHISLQKNTCALHSKLLLSGQYATLTRGYYQYGSLDTTISPTYYADIFRNIPDKDIHQDSALKIFPFTYGCTIKGTNQQVLSTMEGMYVVDLANLVNVHYENLDTKFFKANYQHDFTGKEEFIVELNFDQLVKINNINDYNVEVRTKGFLFSSELVKVADNQFGLKVVWDVKQEITETQDMPTLQEAFKDIKKLTQLKLKVSVQ